MAARYFRFLTSLEPRPPQVASEKPEEPPSHSVAAPTRESLPLRSCHLSPLVLPALQPLPPPPPAWNTASILRSQSPSWAASAQTLHPPGSFPCPHRVLARHSGRPEDSSLLALGRGS